MEKRLFEDYRYCIKRQPTTKRLPFLFYIYVTITPEAIRRKNECTLHTPDEVNVS